MLYEKQKTQKQEEKFFVLRFFSYFCNVFLLRDAFRGKTKELILSF